MVIESLNSSSIYEHVSPLFAKAFEFLKSTDFTTIECGKIEIEGDDLFAIVSNSKLKTSQEVKLEVHNKYIDIQMPIDKIESFGWQSRSCLTASMGEFNEERDIQFFGDHPAVFFFLSPGSYVIFFPDDGHAPCLGEGEVKKVVVKIKV